MKDKKQLLLNAPSAERLMQEFHKPQKRAPTVRNLEINPITGECSFEDTNGNVITGIIEHINWDAIK